MSLPRPKDIGSLDVTVDDASEMSGIECIGCLNCQRERQFDWQGTTRRSAL
jgi:hypothetical protein